MAKALHPTPHRKKVKGDPKTRKRRMCLGWCGKTFMSEWVGHRFCPRCADRRKWADTPESTYDLSGRVW
jgi:ribosomal protein S27AE